MKYIRVNSDMLVKLRNCFADVEEYKSFVGGFNQVIDDHLFTSSKIAREEDSEKIVVLSMRQLVVMALYFRDNIDIIHQIISILDCREVSEDEMNQLKSDHSVNFLEME